MAPPVDPLQRGRAQCGRATQGGLGEDDGQPLDGGRVRGDQPLGQPGDPGQLGGLGEHLEVGGAVEQLVLQRQVGQQGLVERAGLLDGGLHEGAEAAEGRGDDVRDAAEVAQLRGDLLGARGGVVGVLRQLAADGLGAGLRDAGAGDLGLGRVAMGRRAPRR